MFWLEPGPLSSTTTNIIYLCRPLIRYVKIVAGMILLLAIVLHCLINLAQTRSRDMPKNLRNIPILFSLFRERRV